MKWRIFIPCLVLLASTTAAQQTSMRTQHFFNIASVNGAYMGSLNSLSASLAHREQWIGLEGAPQRSELIVHSPLGEGRVGVGLHLTREKVGAHTQTYLQGTYAYRFPLWKGKLGLAVSAGAVHYAFDWKSLEYEAEGDPIPSQSNPGTWVPQFNASVLYSNTRGYVGVEARQLNNSRFISGSDSESRLVDQFQVCTGYAFPVSEMLDLKPAALMRWVPGLRPAANVSIGALYNNVFWLGGGYEWKVGYLAYMQVTVAQKLKVGYSYDFSDTALGTVQQGSHEIMLSYAFNVFSTELSSPRYF